MEIQELHKHSDRIWYMDPTVDTDRPALGYVRGDKISIMIDAGNSPAHVELFYEKLKEEGLPLPSLCLITHWHWDHTLGVRGLGIPAICSTKTAEYLAQDMDIKAMYDSNENMINEYGDANYDQVQFVVPEITFDNKMYIDLGGVSAQFIFVGGPHSDDGAIIFIPEEKFVFGGDSSSGNFALPRIAYDMDLLDEHEAILKSLDFETYLHAHRPIYTREGFFKFLDAGRRRGYYIFEDED